MTQKPLPTALPTDNTPETYSATGWKMLLVEDDATVIIHDVTVKTGNADTAANATSITVVALTSALPSGVTLDFGGVHATLTQDSALGDTSLDVEALSGAIPKNTEAVYSNLAEVPLGEQFQMDMPSDEETVKVHGRATPIRIVNGKDLTMSAKSVAGLTDPTVKRLQRKGRQLSPGCRQRVILKASDGYAVLAMVNVTAKLTGQPGQAQRWEFGMNLSGKLFDADLNDTTPAWEEIGGLN